MDDDKTRTRQLFSKSLALEKELRNLLKQKNPLDKDVIVLRETLRDHYEKIIFLDYHFATSKEIEQSLWKVAFYKVIEEFRLRIRQALSESKQYRSSTTPTTHELEKLKSAFRLFLDNATNFYSEFLKKFQMCHKLILDKPAPESDTRYLTVHRTLIFLGDLARYRHDLHSNTDEWTSAADYYCRAIRLLPSYGNPHNQLAVLSVYSDDDFQAVYHYFRSLSVAHPFLTARDNLTVLFEKNRQKLLESVNTQKTRRPKEGRLKVSFLKKVLTKFVRLHGILFSKTSLETFESLKSSTLTEFETLLNNQTTENALTDDLLVQLFVINIFEVSNASGTIGGQQPQHIDVSLRPVLVQKTFSLALDTFLVVAKYTYQTTELKYLKSTSLFLEWLKYNTHYIQRSDFELSRWNASREHLATFLNFVSSVYNQFLQEGYDFEHSERKDRPLPEEVELHGFTPLSEAFRHLDFSTETLSDVIPEPLSSFKAQDIMNKIKSLSKESTKKIFTEYEECIARRMNKIRTFGLIAANTQISDLPNERLLYKKDNLFVTTLPETKTEESHQQPVESSVRVDETTTSPSNNNNNNNNNNNTKPVLQPPSSPTIEEINHEKLNVPDQRIQLLKHSSDATESSLKNENETNLNTSNDADVEDEVILFKPMANGNNKKTATETTRTVSIFNDKEPSTKHDSSLPRVEHKHVSQSNGQSAIGSQRTLSSSNDISKSSATSSSHVQLRNDISSKSMDNSRPLHYSPLFSPDISSFLKESSLPQFNSFFSSKSPNITPNSTSPVPVHSSLFQNTTFSHIHEPKTTSTTTSVLPSVWAEQSSGPQFLHSLPPLRQHTPQPPIAPPPGFDNSHTQLHAPSPFFINNGPTYSPFLLPGFQSLSLPQQQQIQHQILQLQQLQLQQQPQSQTQMPHTQQQNVTLQTSNPFIT